LKHHTEGQALFEFLIFTPLFLGLIALMISISGSINGGINQQKAVRGYFYNILKGNSYVESSFDLKLLQNSIKTIGFFALGYQEKSMGVVPYAPCYRLHMFGQKDGEGCDTPQTGDGKTEFIRVMNMYGVCGATLSRVGGGGDYINAFENSPCAVAD